MKNTGSVIHSFVIKIRLTDAVTREDALDWYGRITHVPGNEQQFFSELSEIIEFIKPYLIQKYDTSSEKD